MGKTYKAVEITKPGTFRLVEKSVVGPGEKQVRIRVEACGVCHSDAGTVEGQLPGVVYPRVPGHEAIGRVEEVGQGVTTWQIGQRVGVGFFGGEDGTCETCRRGDTAYCQNPIITGVTSDGGYAEMMIAEARALALIPDELKSEDAAPLVCAGITTFQCAPQRRTRRRYRRYPGHWWVRTSWRAVCQEDGFSHRCNRLRSRQRTSCAQTGSALLHRRQS